MILKANVLRTDVVFEIGPGTGNMTMKLLEKAKKVICVEKDYRMVVELHKRIQGSGYEHKLKIIHDDVLKINLPFFNLCIANIPYQISSKITFRLINHRPQFRCAMIMFQKEFGEKLVAKPGSPLYCRLSCNAQLMANVYFMMKISRNSYRPPPKVDSCVVRIEPKNPAPKINFDEWDGLTRILFNRKNKKIKSNFKGKKLLALLLLNFKTHLSLHGPPGEKKKKARKSSELEDELEEEEEEDSENDSEEDEEENQPQGKGVKLTKREKMMEKVTVKDIKRIVADVFEETGLMESRARSMKNVEILKLLSAFNKRGIHFR